MRVWYLKSGKPKSIPRGLQHVAGSEYVATEKRAAHEAAGVDPSAWSIDPPERRALWEQQRLEREEQLEAARAGAASAKKYPSATTAVAEGVADGDDAEGEAES